MPFIVIGTFLLLLSFFLIGYAHKTQDKAGLVGSMMVLIAALIILLFYGLLTPWMSRL
jgi:hypothetical protein